MDKQYFSCLILLLLCNTFPVFSQDSLSVRQNPFRVEGKSMINVICFSPGISVQRQVFGEANVLFGSAINSGMVMGVAGLRFGAESNFRPGNEHIFGLKAGAEFDALVVAFRASVIDYFHAGTSQLRLLPEIGFTWGGLYTITYGYGIKLTDTDIPDISHHRLSLSINLNKRLHRFVNE